MHNRSAPYAMQFYPYDPSLSYGRSDYNVGKAFMAFTTRFSSMAVTPGWRRSPAAGQSAESLTGFPTLKGSKIFVDCSYVPSCFVCHIVIMICALSACIVAGGLSSIRANCIVWGLLPDGMIRTERMLCKSNCNLDLQSVKGYTPADAWARKS
jgi:hypothetical protein